MLTDWRCIICGKPAPDYKPEYCCNETDCSCCGQPLEPCTCSKKCEQAMSDFIGFSYEERREKAGIPVWAPLREEGK